MQKNADLGNVQYSVLEPAVFRQVNGEGWVLMDGRNIQDSELFRLSGLTILPDARGLFLRSMNEGRDVNQGDADGNRAIGNYQADAFKSHAHQISPAHAVMDNDLGTNGCEGGHDVRYGRSVMSSSEYGGLETRPRNISLYLYIKIN
ncbi:hypothetical protein A4H97_17995 [Niastella yeongjuensis]|uniref:Phage tail collar domain-containing protein n=1 Tax=Niastella yeongjuensis TaxID=354355 RepID=A0A1V9DXL7_9BACT|nr:hypothetical protein [Niastella yeongjuensis]OQP38617.1 hypothetical protein A4H97_17995 [Niastella yeongjuensis]SEO39374.1 hypothetical protein SAMN05660816_02804 [Niastella yeongjuensis]